MQRQALEISWVSLWRVLFFVVFAILLYTGRNVLLGLFLAIVISSGFEAMVNFLERRGLPRVLGVILVFLVSAFIVVLTVYTAIPLIVIDLNTILVSIDELANTTPLGPLIGPETTRSLGEYVNRLSMQFFATGRSPIVAFSDIVGGLVLAASIIMSSFYLSLTPDGVERFIRAIFPATHEEMALRIYERTRKRIGLWFRSQILLSAIIAILVFGALFFLGVRHAFLLAVLAGIFELIPFLGPILAGAAAVLSALITSPSLAFVTLIVFLFIHQVENHLLVPVLVGRKVGLHPVTVIVALLIGVEAGGMLGILISVPAVVLLQEIMEDFSPKRHMPQTA